MEVGGCALCTRDAGGYAPCAALYSGGHGGELRLVRGDRVMRYVLEAEKDVRHVLGGAAM